MAMRGVTGGPPVGCGTAQPWPVLRTSQQERSDLRDQRNTTRRDGDDGGRAEKTKEWILFSALSPLPPLLRVAFGSFGTRNAALLLDSTGVPAEIAGYR